MHVVVIVLGDVGRSPRMQYHALSLLQEGYTVSLVGYEGEDLIPDLAQYSTGKSRNDNENELRLVRFSTNSSPAIASFLRKVFPPLYFVWRAVSLVLALLYTLGSRVGREVDCVLVQNPPAIPLLFVAYLYCRFTTTSTTNNRNRTRLIIDWHNLGYSMLKPNSLIQKIAKRYEQFMAPLADGHLCVTKAMKEFLVHDMGISTTIPISVLYDCPPAMFQPLTVKEQHVFFKRLQQESLLKECKWIQELSSNDETLFTTEETDNTIRHRRNRPVLVTSSTSWTADEDFGVLLEALVSIDARLVDNKESNFRMLVLVTGKGPMKEYYQERISKLTLHHVAIHTLWLSPGDYPRLLACADVGISLHTSTSGLDLPMKVLDLFGCEVPVCAITFDCLGELVQDKVNGRVFDGSATLASQLYYLFASDFIDQKQQQAGLAPHSYGDLATYSANLKGRPRWSENWKAHALPVVLAGC